MKTLLTLKKSKTENDCSNLINHGGVMKIGYLRHIMALGALKGLFFAPTTVLAEGEDFGAM